MNEKYINKYLIKPADDGSREDTKLAVEYSDEQIEEFKSQGYLVVEDEDFQKLIGNDDGKEYLIAKDGTLSEKPPYEPTLEDVRKAKLQELKDAYLKDLYAPYWFNQILDLPDGTTIEKYVGYDTDKDSQVDFTNSQRRADLLGHTMYNIYVNPENLKEKEFTYHTPAMFERTLLAVGDYQEQVVYPKYYKLKAQAEAATSKEELANINW